MSEPAAAIRIVVCGATGRMGRTVARLAGDDAAFDVVGGIDREGAAAEANGFPVIAAPDGCGELIADADVIIDFSAPALLLSLLRTRESVASTVPLVVGTTGLDDEVRSLLESDSERAPVLTAANFSLGVNLLLELVETAARTLGPEYDVEIVEAHHRRKEDAPSGTALALGEAVAAGRRIELASARRDGRSGRPGARPVGEVGFHAVRGGDVIGDHQVHFLGDLERIEITHRASDRAIFAAGALHAARWLATREPGWSTTRQVLGL